MAGSISDAYNAALSKYEAKGAIENVFERTVDGGNTQTGHADGVHRDVARSISNSLTKPLERVNPEQDIFHGQAIPSPRVGKRRTLKPPPTVPVKRVLNDAEIKLHRFCLELRTLAKKKVQKPPLVFSVPRYPHLRDPRPLKLTPAVPVTRVLVDPEVELVWSAGYQDSSELLKVDEHAGVPAQMPGPLGRNRELVIGMDFGTSSVKLVVGDRGADKAYAVPFLDATGVNAYLLPSRVCEQSGVFSLSAGEEVHRDLKLRFLANPSSQQIQETLVGFLALVIRRCRAWLFSAHADILAKRTILWKLVLGRAIDRAQDDQVGKIMADVLNAAWIVAGRLGVVDRTDCGRVLAGLRGGQISQIDAPEVSVVPELAAQIYGFVKSRQFDPRAKNFYLFIDVGAGTVDTSLFRVKPNEFGTWDFSLFTSVVQPNGVMNLHRARLDWWRNELSKLHDSQCNRLLEKISSIHAPTEQTRPIPEDYLGYFKGIQVQQSGGALNPDELFFTNRLVAQVRGQGIQRTVLSKNVGRVDLDNIPFFLCGGGARLPLYRKIASALNGAPDLSWFKANRRELGIPSELVAPGLPQIDYDRLSVAFGLSFVDVGTVAIAKAMPAITQRSNVDWRSGYVDKDAC